MGTQIFLGKPPANIEAWIKEHAAPVAHEETWYKYNGDTEWRTTMLSGEIALFDFNGESTGQIENPFDIVAIEIGTGTQANPVTSIGTSAFYYCSGLTSVTIPGTVTSIGDQAFSDCTSLTSVTIPDGVTSIGAFTFYSCVNLTEVMIPNTVKSIGESAFSSCYRLTSITIPASVTSIGQMAFWMCSGLTSVTFDCFDVSTTKSLITNDSIFGSDFYNPDTWEQIEKTFLVTCTDGSFNVTFRTDYTITFQDL